MDTAKLDGQFDMLLKAEEDGAEVYYAAPRFAKWDSYVDAYQSGRILNKSLIISPVDIRNKIYATGSGDGWHKIAYDDYSSYVCSEPAELDQISGADLAANIKTQIDARDNPFSIALKKAYASLHRRREVRIIDDTQLDDEEPAAYSVRKGGSSLSVEGLNLRRQRRLEIYRSKSDREEQAMFASFGIETLAVGAQLIAVTKDQ